MLTPYIHAIQGVCVLKEQQRLMRKMAKDIDAGEFDVVFATDSLVMACPFVLRYLLTPSMFYCHSLERPYHREKRSDYKEFYYSPAYHLFENVYRLDEIKNAQAAHIVATNSVFSSEELISRYRRKVSVIYPGIDANLFCPLNLPRQEYVLCVGALTRQKGYRFLIQAISLIKEEMRPSLLVVANHVDSREFRIVNDMARNLGVSFKIETVTNDDRLVELYNQAKAFVYAPHNEALGLAPLEAMACGTAVVAVGEGGIVETVPNRDGGWLVNRDSEAFAQKLTEVLTGNDRATPQILRDYVIKNWSWGENLHQLEQILFDAAS